MMKCVLGFILLFHLCHSLTATFEVNGEIIRGLGELDTLYKNKSLILVSIEMITLNLFCLLSNAPLFSHC